MKKDTLIVFRFLVSVGAFLFTIVALLISINTLRLSLNFSNSFNQIEPISYVNDQVRTSIPTKPMIPLSPPEGTVVTRLQEPNGNEPTYTFFNQDGEIIGVEINREHRPIRSDWTIIELNTVDEYDETGLNVLYVSSVWAGERENIERIRSIIEVTEV